MDPVAPEGGGGTSIWAFNIWPLITTAFNGQSPVMGVIGGVKDVLPNQFLVFSYFQVGIILFGLAYVILAVRIWKATNLQNTFLQFGLLMLAFYILPTRVHERYLFFGSGIPSAIIRQIQENNCFLPHTPHNIFANIRVRLD